MTRVLTPDTIISTLNALKFRFTPRVWLFAATLILKIVAVAASAIAYGIINRPLVIIAALVWLGYFAALFIIALPQSENFLKKYTRWLKPAAKVSVTMLLVIGVLEVALIGVIAAGAFDDSSETVQDLVRTFERTQVYNDATALSHQATENFLQGEDPYREADIISALNEHEIPTVKLTPVRAGQFADDFPYPSLEKMETVWAKAVKTPDVQPVEFESKYNYPAASFVLAAPFFALGADDYRIVLAVIPLLVLGYVIWRIKLNRWRLLLAVILLASLELWNQMTAGETSVLAFPFLLLAWLFAKRRWLLSAIFMGIAIAVKQTAWFFLPFYLILMLREYGFKKAFYISVITGGVFLSFNLPYVVQDYYLWLGSIFAPLTGDLFPSGVGIVTLVMAGIVDIGSTPFLVVELAVMLAGAVWYYRNCRRYPNTGLVLAVLPLFFAWRSGWSYFFFIDIILLVAILFNEYRVDRTDKVPVLAD